MTTSPSTVRRTRSPARLANQRGRDVTPFLFVCGWIALSVGLHALGWSTLFDSFSIDTVLLLAVTFVLFAALSLAFTSSPYLGRPITLSDTPVLVVLGYFFVACLANGGVPILLILRGVPYDIYSFGVPYLHVVMLAYCGYAALRYVADYLDTGSRRALLSALVIAFSLAAIASRSAVSFLLLGCVVLYLGKRGLTPLRATALAVVAAISVYVFGVFGNRRLAFQIEQATGLPASDNAILAFGHASDGFVALGLPSWLMWTYLYASSPIDNLMSAFSYAGTSLCGRTCDVPGLITYSLMPDLVGRRLGDALGIAKFDKSVFLEVPSLTAATTFGTAVGYAGLLGALAVLALLVGISVVTVTRLDGSPLRAVGLAILSLVLFFSFFENMISYSPLSLQLVMVLVADARCRRLRSI